MVSLNGKSIQDYPVALCKFSDIAKTRVLKFGVINEPKLRVTASCRDERRLSTRFYARMISHYALSCIVQISFAAQRIILRYFKPL